ncbi:UNVERIFIED_CONTAM: hypothetical protein GTU68_066662, partial [Idotea baltica]|nr:hypothetical protein [Idotea baltica]
MTVKSYLFCTDAVRESLGGPRFESSVYIIYNYGRERARKYSNRAQGFDSDVHTFSLHCVHELIWKVRLGSTQRFRVTLLRVFGSFVILIHDWT